MGGSTVSGVTSPISPLFFVASEVVTVTATAIATAKMRVFTIFDIAIIRVCY